MRLRRLFVHAWNGSAASPGPGNSTPVTDEQLDTDQIKEGFSISRQLKRIRSTQVEPTPAEPVTTQAPLGRPDSTSAEPFDDKPVTTSVTHLNEPITVHSPTPGPVTMTVGWLADIESKVIEPDEQTGPAPARTQAHTKTSRTRARARDE